MSPEDQIVLEFLKERLVQKMKISFPEIPDQLSEWKGQNIVDFQNALLEEQHAQISEKWFYTHMKRNHSALPRIDVLNFLSRFVGYRSWESLVLSRSQGIEPNHGKAKDRSNKVFIWVPVITLLILIVFILLIIYSN